MRKSRQPSRKHPSPTGQSILEYFSRQNIGLVGFKIEDVWHWKISGLTDMCRTILKFLKIEHIYEEVPAGIMGLEN
ncbi:MAG: hypothetical protein H0W50_10055 [Parachlamydiaceae bacterium]|nr:hypothetical protein [Parachlamydiaceae bacterium]